MVEEHNINQLLEIIKERQGNLSDRQFAAALDISQTLWNLIKTSTREPGLEFLRAVIRKYPDIGEVALSYIMKEPGHGLRHPPALSTQPQALSPNPTEQTADSKVDYFLHGESSGIVPIPFGEDSPRPDITSPVQSSSSGQVLETPGSVQDASHGEALQSVLPQTGEPEPELPRGIATEACQAHNLAEEGSTPSTAISSPPREEPDHNIPAPAIPSPVQDHQIVESEEDENDRDAPEPESPRAGAEQGLTNAPHPVTPQGEKGTELSVAQSPGGAMELMHRSVDKCPGCGHYKPTRWELCARCRYEQKHNHPPQKPDDPGVSQLQSPPQGYGNCQACMKKHAGNYYVYFCGVKGYDPLFPEFFPPYANFKLKDNKLEPEDSPLPLAPNPFFKYRIFHRRLGKYWEGYARNSTDALKEAGWTRNPCWIRQYTYRGGWGKPTDGLPGGIPPGARDKAVKQQTVDSKTQISDPLLPGDPVVKKLCQEAQGWDPWAEYKKKYPENKSRGPGRPPEKDQEMLNQARLSS